MHLDSSRTPTPASLPLQFVHVEITPLAGGEFSVSMQATLLDERDLEFVGEHLADERVACIEDVLGVIRRNVAALAPM